MFGSLLRTKRAHSFEPCLKFAKTLRAVPEKNAVGIVEKCRRDKDKNSKAGRAKQKKFLPINTLARRDGRRTLARGALKKKLRGLRRSGFFFRFQFFSALLGFFVFAERRADIGDHLGNIFSRNGHHGRILAPEKPIAKDYR